MSVTRNETGGVIEVSIQKHYRLDRTFVFIDKLEECTIIYQALSLDYLIDVFRDYTNLRLELSEAKKDARRARLVTTIVVGLTGALAVTAFLLGLATSPVQQPSTPAGAAGIAQIGIPRRK